MEGLDAVGVVSFALADVTLGSLGFEALVFNSIPVAAAPSNSLTCQKTIATQSKSLLFEEGAYGVVSKESVNDTCTVRYRGT